MNAPFKGEWQRGGENESMMRFSVRGRPVELVVKTSYDGVARVAINRWLVDALEAWPHPNAPVSEGEVDYPAYRQSAYKEIANET